MDSEIRDSFHTCALSQHTGPEVHFGPHSSTSCFRAASSGSAAKSLSGQGNSEPKKDFFPQVPRIAHLPASCFGVNGSHAARVAERIATHGNSRPIVVLRPLTRTAWVREVKYKAATRHGKYGYFRVKICLHHFVRYSWSWELS